MAPVRLETQRHQRMTLSLQSVLLPSLRKPESGLLAFAMARCSCIRGMEYEHIILTLKGRVNACVCVCVSTREAGGGGSKF